MQPETPGYCGVTQTESINGIPVGPLEVEPETRLALEIYHTAVALSGYDVFGLPQITNLALALELRRIELTDEQLSHLTNCVLYVSTRHREHLEATRKKDPPPPAE